MAVSSSRLMRQKVTMNLNFIHARWQCISAA
jgi:hypothetical protein